MQLTNVVLKNVRQFELAKFKFQPGFNLLIGENGTGKTTVLRSLLAVAGAREFCSIANLGFGMDDIKLGVNQLEVKAGFVDGNGRPLSLSYSRDIAGNIKRTGSKSKITLLFFQSNESLVGSLKPKKGRRVDRPKPLNSNSIEEFLYQTQEGINLEIEQKQRFGRSQEIREFVSRALKRLSPNFTDFSWRFEALDCLVHDQKQEVEANSEIKKACNILSNLLLRSMRENPDKFAGIDQRKIIINSEGNILGSGSPAVSASDSFLKLLDRADVHDIPRGIFSNGSFVAEVKLAPRIVVMTSNGPLPLAQLSDGEKRLFSLIIDIARVLSLSSSGRISDATSVVVIDEIDVHLHPRWQREIIPSLEDLFPSCQFIASTHSPFIIQSAGRARVQKPMLGGGERIESSDSESIEDIVEDVQNIPMPQRGRRAETMHKTAKRYFSLLQQEDSNTEELEAAELDYRMASEPYSSKPAINALLQIEKQKAKR